MIYGEKQKANEQCGLLRPQSSSIVPPSKRRHVINECHSNMKQRGTYLVANLLTNLLANLFLGHGSAPGARQCAEIVKAFIL